MRVLTQTELSRMTRTELMALLRRLWTALPELREGSVCAIRTRTCRTFAGRW
jgi:hypothetical protein